MTKRLITIALTAAIALAAVPAQAAAQQRARAHTGNELLEECKSKGASGLFCLGFVRGLAEGLTLWRSFAPESAITCIPEGVTTGQLKDIVVKWLADNPKDRHLGADALVARAFRVTWPCEQGRP
jgi:Rap1a immunity proteins